jgi:hypothetical protein
MSLRAKFTEHPASVGETYGEHFVTAAGFSLSLFRAAFVCAIHALLPFAFEKTGSKCISGLHDRMVTHRSRLDVNEESLAVEAD